MFWVAQRRYGCGDDLFRSDMQICRCGRWSFKGRCGSKFDCFGKFRDGNRKLDSGNC